MKHKGKLELPLAAITNFCKRWKVKEFSIFGAVFRRGVIYEIKGCPYA